jgi:hypothetical protein
MVPVLIIILGLSFLLNVLGVWSNGVQAIMWPIIIILIGLQKIMGGQCQCCHKK